MHSSVEQYLAFLNTKHRAPATVKVVCQDLAHFAAWWEGARQRTFDPALLRHEDLRDWRLARQRDDGAAPATINRGLASLRETIPERGLTERLLERASPPCSLLSHSTYTRSLESKPVCPRSGMVCANRSAQTC